MSSPPVPALAAPGSWALLLAPFFTFCAICAPTMDAAKNTGLADSQHGPDPAVRLDQSRINDIGWTDVHLVAYGWPILTDTGDSIAVPSDRLSVQTFLQDATDDFLCLQNDFGQTALHLAVRQDHQELVSFLVTRQLPCLDRANRDGDTPLHYAAAWGRANLAKVLVEGGADLSVQNDHGKTPLEDAMSFGHEDVRSVLAGG